MSTESSIRWSKKNPEKAAAKGRAWRRRNPSYMLHHGAKRRAEIKGIVFEICKEDIPEIPTHCPLTGIEIKFREDGGQGPWDHSPSLDRINPLLGYVKGNLRVISHKGNRWKDDMTREDVQRLLDYFDGKI